MRRHHLRGSAEPERLSVTLRDLEVCGPREDGQFEYTAIAQFFNIVNDRLMVFRMGSFAKTIAENVRSGSGRVKINDGHRHSSKDTLGTVIEAEERSEGVWYRGLMSSTEEKIFTKMREGHVDENSIEFFPITEGVTRVPLSDVPTGAWLWDQAKGDETVEAREMLEVAWVGIAILPFSSQGRRALLETNAAVPFQDLPVAGASTNWDPEGAAVRLRRWAGTVDMPSRQKLPNFAKLSRGFLVRGPIQDGEPVLLGQIADVIDGQLVVVPDAVDAALATLSTEKHITPAEIMACARSAERYMQKLGRSATGTKLARSTPAELPSESGGDPAGPATLSTGKQPPTDDARSNETPDGANTLAGQRLKLLSLRLESVSAAFPEVASNEPTGTGRKSASDGRPEV